MRRGAWIRRAAVTATIAGLAATAAASDAAWSVTAMGGGAWSARTRLDIEQQGQPDIRVHARWHTRSLDAPPYWVAGLARRSGGHEWSLELIHDKLYLGNPPPEVQAFSVSHGYNLVLAGHGFEVQPGLWVRLGAGVVVGHPESTVRGQVLDQGRGVRGYYLSGAAVFLALEERIDAWRLHFIFGARGTAAYAEVPVAGGFARVPNVAVHANVGLAFDFVR